jgi:hypothetical protein
LNVADFQVVDEAARNALPMAISWISESGALAR